MLLNTEELQAIHDIVNQQAMHVFDVTKEVRNLSDTIDFITITVDDPWSDRIWIWRNNHPDEWADYAR